MFVFLKQDKLYLTQSEKIRDEFLMKGNKGSSLSFSDEKFAIHIDIQQMLSKFSQEALKYFNIDQAVMISKEAESIDLQLNGMDDQIYNCAIQLHLLNKSENSLYTILEMYNASIKVPRFNEQINDLVTSKN